MILLLAAALLAQAEPARVPLAHKVVDALPSVIEKSGLFLTASAGFLAAWQAFRAKKAAQESVAVTVAGNEVTEAVRAQGDALAAKANAVIDTAQETKEAVQKAHDAVNAVGCNHADELKALRERLEELERRAPAPPHRSHHTKRETED